MTTDTDLALMPATRLAAAIRSRRVSPVEATQAALDRIEALNPAVNAFVTVLAEQALEQARQCEKQLIDGSDSIGPLHGVPVTVKDLTPTAGVRTTYGSRHYAEHVPEEDALAWARVKDAGAVLLGKTTTPEFGWLGITDSPLTGVTRNPWNLDRTSGGSSGGAAVATALGMGAIGTGSDGAGSIRIPAACCGVVGLKASAGRVPIYGEDLIYATTEAMGPLARTVDDAALMLAVMSGPDEREAYPLPTLDSPLSASRRAPDPGLRVGYVATIAGVPVEPDVADRVSAAAALLADHLVVEAIELTVMDPVDQMLRFWRPAISMFVDDLIAQGLPLPDSHPVIARLAEEGRRMSAADLWQASVVDRGILHGQIASAFASVDLLLMPTMPLTAFPHPGPEGGPTSIAGFEVDWPFAAFLAFTAPFNMTGHPAVSLPCGFDSAGLPVGVQLIGTHGRDIEVLQVARLLEELFSFNAACPPLVVGGAL